MTTKTAKALTEREQSILQAIQNFIKKHGYPPTTRELCKLVYLSSTSSVHIYLSRLEEKGYISQAIGKARTIKVLREV